MKPKAILLRHDSDLPKLDTQMQSQAYDLACRIVDLAGAPRAECMDIDAKQALQIAFRFVMVLSEVEELREQLGLAEARVLH